MKSLKFWQTQKFKELERHWYDTLKEHGFDDAEKFLGGVFVLKQRASNSYRSISAVEREAKLNYYRILSSHFEQENFQDEVERLVMERRANGVKIKFISNELRGLPKFGSRPRRSHRQTVRFIIRKFEIKWGIRKKT